MDIFVLIVLMLVIPFILGIIALVIAIKGYTIEDNISVVYVIDYTEKESSSTAQFVVFKYEDDAIAYQRQHALNVSIQACKIV